MKPLLSICVPTYNRAAMLRVMLEAVLPQVAAEHGDVELCLSDNASPDATPQVVEEARALGPIRASRNAENLGPIGNFQHITHRMAAGEYVWLLGDDDLVRPGAVRRVVQAIRDHRDLDAFYVNFNSARYSEHWPGRAPGGYDGPCDSTVHADQRSRRVERWEELISPQSSFCTQVYVHILRRPIWQGLSEGGVLGEPYSSFRWTWPHTYMTARAMFSRPAYFLGEPAVTIFNRQAEWFGHMPRMILEFLPDLVQFYRRLGLSEQRAAECLRHIDQQAMAVLRRLLLGVEPGGVGEYLRRNWHRPRTWRLLGSVLSELYGDWRFFGSAMVPPAVPAGGDRRAGTPSRGTALLAPAHPGGRNRRIKACFVAPHAYPLLNPSVSRPIGGIETRSVLFARGLARRPDYDVTFLVHDFGQPQGEQIDGITVTLDPLQRRRRDRIDRIVQSMQSHANRVRECLPRSERFPGFRIAGLRPRLIWDVLAVAGSAARFRWFPPSPVVTVVECPQPQSVYREIGADIYVGFGANCVTAKMIASCREYGGVSVLFLASDLNLSSSYIPGSRKRDGEGEICGNGYYAIAHADFILVQTDYQRRLLRERFGREARVIRNPIVLEEPRGVVPAIQDRRFILWIGRADRHSKRPALCLEAAARCPEVPFLMIMNQRCPEVFEEIQRSLPANVRMVERVAPAEMPGLFRQARALLSTTHLEGFPNTFLQAGKYGVPIVSLDVDPDRMFQQRGCGLWAAGDVGRLAEQLRAVWHDDALAAGLAQRLQDYVEQYHEAGARVDELDATLRAFLGAPAQAEETGCPQAGETQPRRVA